MKWSVVYKSAYNPDGSLLFPERLTHEFLKDQRKIMGSYLFANQYKNEVIPEDEKRFKPQWLRYSNESPTGCYSFGFIDPAIGQKDHHDYTGIVVIDAHYNGDWYVRHASRDRLTPSEIVSKMFDICAEFKLKSLGVEIVAYQEALLYFLDAEMKRRKKIIPVTGIKRNNISKASRILGLVPRFEWNRIYLRGGLTDLEDEYNTFPRGSHDDILDSLASLEELVYYPQEASKVLEKPHSPHDPNYERWVIQNIHKKQQEMHED